METFKVILHTNGNDKCLYNVMKYPIDKDQIIAEGFGVNPYDPKAAMVQFKNTAKFWNNQDKTPIFHYMTSFTDKTAPTAEKAMELTKKIFEPLTNNHLALIGTHNKERGESSMHTHTAMSPTNINDGSMLYGDNTTNYALAQRTANITGQPTKLVVMKENRKEWTCPKIFIPQSDEDE